MGRPHVAQALLEAGHVTSYGEAFEKYIGRNSPAYVERMKFTPSQASHADPARGRSAGAGAPGVLRSLRRDQVAVDLDTMLPDLIAAG